VSQNGVRIARVDHTDEVRADEVRGGEARADEVRLLGEAAAGLAGRLPGNVRRIAVRSGDHAVDIEWHGAGLASPNPVREVGDDPDRLVDAGADPGPAHVIVAPLVGTFYRAPEPGAAPFVEVGDLVEPGQPVGIIEAMKLMNPVVVETAGRVVAIYVENGRSVEYGQHLVGVSADTG
jgi:acetyl-CoA carboxylase biotin carboxyl carrier protein